MQINKRRRGRPRQNRPSIDKDTEELQKKRRIFLEEGQRQDLTLAESLLGILYGRQLISKSLYEAGCFFGELGYRYEPCIGHKFRQNTSMLSYKRGGSQGHSSLQWSEEQETKRAQAWQQALTALKQSGSKPYQIVLDVVFFDQDLYTIPFSKQIITFLPPLRKGLKSLEVYFTGGSQGVRDKRFDRGLNLGQATTFQPFLKEHRFCSHR